MGNAIIIPENIMALPNFLTVAGSEASATMADDNLANEQPSKFWRSTQASPDCTWFYGRYSKSRTFDVNSVAIVGHNMKRGDQYRAWCHTSSVTPTRANGFETINPNTNIALVNTTAAANAEDVNNGFDSTPATWAVPAAPGSTWGMTVGFTTPTQKPVVGVDMQSFWIFVKTNVDATLNPMAVSVSLYESGVSVLALGTRYATSAVGQWLFFSWNASSIATDTGANVECLVSISGHVTYWVSIGSIVWAADIDTRTNDSGWLTYNPDISTGITHRTNAGEQHGTTLVRLPATTDTSYRVYTTLRVCRSPLDFDEISEVLPSVMDYAEVGTYVVGETWSPSVNFAYGKLVGGVDISPKKRTYGGQLFGSRRPVRRVVSLKLGHLTPAECHTLFDRMIWRHGVMKPFLISLLPDDTTQNKHTTIFGVLRNPENWVNIQPEQGYENNMEMDFEEVL